MVGAVVGSLTTALLSRLPAPVVRLDWRLLTAALRRSDANPAGGVEGTLVMRYSSRRAASVAAALSRWWEAALVGGAESGMKEVTLSKAAFTLWHALLSHALLSSVDERGAQVIADCEWALFNGTERGMSRATFDEWAFEVLEAWSAETGVPALVALAGELLEALVVPHATTLTLRAVGDVEWVGLSRPGEQIGGAPPTVLNWPQTRRLVEAALSWRAAHAPTKVQLTEISNGRMMPPEPPSGGRQPPSARVDFEGASGDARARARAALPVGASASSTHDISPSLASHPHHANGFLGNDAGGFPLTTMPLPYDVQPRRQVREPMGRRDERARGEAMARADAADAGPDRPTAPLMPPSLQEHAYAHPTYHHALPTHHHVLPTGLTHAEEAAQAVQADAVRAAAPAVRRRRRVGESPQARNLPSGIEELGAMRLARAEPQYVRSAGGGHHPVPAQPHPPAAPPSGFELTDAPNAFDAGMRAPRGSRESREDMSPRGVGAAHQPPYVAGTAPYGGVEADPYLGSVWVAHKGGRRGGGRAAAAASSGRAVLEETLRKKEQQLARGGMAAGGGGGGGGGPQQAHARAAVARPPVSGVAADVLVAAGMMSHPATNALAGEWPAGSPSEWNMSSAPAQSAADQLGLGEEQTYDPTAFAAGRPVRDGRGGLQLYGGVDPYLLDELTAIGRDELSDLAFPSNRQLRTDLALWIDSSRQRVGELNRGSLRVDHITPSLAKAALKEGVRVPLEVVRAEVRARRSDWPYAEAVDDEDESAGAPAEARQAQEDTVERPPMA